MKLNRKMLKSLIEEILLKESIDMSDAKSGTNLTGTDSQIYFFNDRKLFNKLVNNITSGGLGFGQTFEEILAVIFGSSDIEELNGNFYKWSFDNFPFADLAGKQITSIPNDTLNEISLKNELSSVIKEYYPGYGEDEYEDEDDNHGFDFKEDFRQNLLADTTSQNGKKIVLYSVKSTAKPDSTTTTGQARVEPSTVLGYSQAVDCAFESSYNLVTEDSAVGDVGKLAPGLMTGVFSGFATFAIGCHGLVFRIDIVTPNDNQFVEFKDWYQARTDWAVNNPNKKLGGSSNTNNGVVASTEGLLPQSSGANHQNADAFLNDMLGGNGTRQSFFVAIAPSRDAEAKANDFIDGKSNLDDTSLIIYSVLKQQISIRLMAQKNAAALKKYVDLFASKRNVTSGELKADSALREVVILQIQMNLANDIAKKLGGSDISSLDPWVQLLLEIYFTNKLITDSSFVRIQKDRIASILDVVNPQNVPVDDIIIFTSTDDEHAAALKAMTESFEALSKYFKRQQMIEAIESYQIWVTSPEFKADYRNFLANKSYDELVEFFNLYFSNPQSKPTIPGLSRVLRERKTSPATFEMGFDDILKPNEYSSQYFDNIAAAIRKMEKPVEDIKEKLGEIGFNPDVAIKAFMKAFLNQTKKGKENMSENKSKKYSLLDLLEEQMVPMPALGVGSAQYDSRRVEDPFDMDMDTQSILGLIGADEVDIDETDVDTDLDGLPNRVDDEDDTPAGFGDMMERFLMNTHQKEDDYKKEKQERQYGLSHAALLKKKYYGRY